MKKLTNIALAFLLVLSVIPAMAGDQAGSNSEQGGPTFQAFGNLPATQLKALTPLTETELASIEGGATCNASGIGAVATCLNLAVITQTNVCASVVGCGFAAGAFLHNSGNNNQANFAIAKQCIGAFCQSR